MTSADLKTLTALLTGLAGVATAVASCNTAAQERLKADNKIYTTLADGQKQQGTELTELHRQLDELRGYLQAARAMPPMPIPAPSSSAPVVLTPLRQLLLKPLPPLPPATPRPVLKALPQFNAL